MVKGLLVDYGGTLDTNGRHWASVLWEAYQQEQIPIERSDFSNAYIYGERMLGKQPIVKPHHTFLDVLILKLWQQFDFLEFHGKVLHRSGIDAIALHCEALARKTVQRSGLMLAQLQRHYKLALVSNFYGNLTTVLKDFGIDGYFEGIVESAVVGVRKPDPRMYRLGAEALGLPPQDCVVIGDSYEKDMIAGAMADCRTIWLNRESWEEPGVDEYDLVDHEIGDIQLLPDVLSQLD